ncbi:lytic murein transglycosylase [Psychrobacter sp. I-STPA6b]|uniref:lytic murein transglycosylase n=1 Tax=Psychrobacter sp. I-STPA6b TaxID=2585718 RepID=UPI001D0C29FB|nr:lytic murein transglycosylase [Psychrobacter sp. I-STPA6b]
MKYFSLPLAFTTIGLSLIANTAYANKPPAPELSNAQLQQCLNSLKNSSKFRGISNYTFEQYRPNQPDPSVIQSLNYQPEFQKDVWDYLSALVDKERVDDGIRAKHQWADTLRRIEARYGVKPEHVLGVWGVESNFGQTLGKKPLFDSLATLSCFDRRQTYFRGEYANALKIVQNGDIHANDMTGSWAGAFGQTQFMPSTFLELAVDFDGDGRRDLVNSVPDALASTANFLVKRGYRRGEPWGYEVKKPANYWGESNRRNKKSMNYWRNQGFTLADGRPLPYDLSQAALIMPAGQNGPAFLVGKNFDTFYSYNASENYALAIAHLSDLLTREDSSKTDFITAWPTDDPGISRQQAKDIQQALLNAGYDIGTVDGIIGDNTRSAIQQYQSSHGIFPADGRAGQKFYRAIMNSSTNNAPSRSSLRQPNFQQPTRYGQYTQPASQSDRMAQLIESQQGYRRVVDADGRIRLVRVDKGH